MDDSSRSSSEMEFTESDEFDLESADLESTEEMEPQSKRRVSFSLETYEDKVPSSDIAKQGFDQIPEDTESRRHFSSRVPGVESEPEMLRGDPDQDPDGDDEPHHLWAHGQHNLSLLKEQPEPEKPKDKATYRRYLILAKVTRRSWPSSAITKSSGDPHSDKTETFMDMAIIHGAGANALKFRIPQEHSGLLVHLLQEDIVSLGKDIVEHHDLSKCVLDNFMHNIKEELKRLCKKDDPSILRRTTKEDLSKFSWSHVWEEWKTKAPTFQLFLENAVSNPSHERNKLKKADALIPGVVSAGCKLLSIFNQDMNAVQRINSVILMKGGAKKSAFSRFSSSFDCLGYQASLNMAEEFGKGWKTELRNWKSIVEEDKQVEMQIFQQIKTTRETIDFLNDDPNEAVESILELAELEKQLEQHQCMAHPGYYFVGDNVDMRTSVRQMTQTNQAKDQHMFQVCAYENRVSGNNLDDSGPKADTSSIPFKDFIPGNVERDHTLNEFAILVARKWTDFIPALQQFQTTLPRYIIHPFMKETSKRTKRINLGVLKKNEQYNEDMADICQFLHPFVPGHDDGEDWTKQPQKILSGGDYLTFERHKGAQSAQRNGRTPSKRLEGLVPKMEEFHNQAEVLQVVWKTLYSTSSSKDVGTLYAARNAINARNVSKEPEKDYYACSELFDKFSAAYLVIGGLKHFGMPSLESEPTKNKYEGDVGDTDAMAAYIYDQALTFVKENADPYMPRIPEYGYQSNTLLCRYCGKKYQRPTALRKHENSLHNHPDPVLDGSLPESKSTVSCDDFVLNYTKQTIVLGLLRLDHNDAIAMGDGARIMRILMYLYLYYKACGCPKYAFGVLETLAQSKALLSERMAHRLVWNRTVNHRGQPDSNHPNDLDIEHCNKAFKEEAHSYRGVFTEKTLSRVSRGAMPTQDIMKNYDKISKTNLSSGKHTTADTSGDVLKLIQQLSKQNLFDQIPSRAHSAFKDIPDSPLRKLDMDSVRDWLSDSLQSFGNKHFY